MTLHARSDVEGPCCRVHASNVLCIGDFLHDHFNLRILGHVKYEYMLIVLRPQSQDSCVMRVIAFNFNLEKVWQRTLGQRGN